MSQKRSHSYRTLGADFQAALCRELRVRRLQPVLLAEISDALEAYTKRPRPARQRRFRESISDLHKAGLAFRARSIAPIAPLMPYTLSAAANTSLPLPPTL